MTFQSFTGKEYLKIDIANNYGLDKLLWDERIQWFDDNAHQLDKLQNSAAEPALFYAGVQAWKAVAQGKPSGYPISLDATCSGIQILSALARDRKAASLCNLVSTGRREDAYTGIYGAMVEEVGESAKITREMTKKAIMTAFYSSTAMPKKVFGDGPLLDAFYKILKENAPGAWEINETMMAIWDENAYSNDWVMPDNFHVHVKVMGKETETVHFLNQPVEVNYCINKPISNGRSLGANMVHSIDGMIVREMGRRCMYDQPKIMRMLQMIEANAKFGTSTQTNDDVMVLILYGHYLKNGFLSARILDYLTPQNMGHVDLKHIRDLILSLPTMPFQVISVHDCFRCLPNHGNDLRRQYNEILACIAESTMLADIVSQLLGREIEAHLLDDTVAADIREANYALS
jgi:hypothetical protein